MIQLRTLLTGTDQRPIRWQVIQRVWLGNSVDSASPDAAISARKLMTSSASSHRHAVVASGIKVCVGKVGNNQRLQQVGGISGDGADRQFVDHAQGVKRGNVATVIHIVNLNQVLPGMWKIAVEHLATGNIVDLSNEASVGNVGLAHPPVRRVGKCQLIIFISADHDRRAPLPESGQMMRLASVESHRCGHVQFLVDVGRDDIATGCEIEPRPIARHLTGIDQLKFIVPAAAIHIQSD